MRRNIMHALSDLISIRSDALGQKRGATVHRQQWPTWWRKLLYYISRVTVNRPLRRGVVWILGTWIGRTAFRGENAHPLLKVLNDEGIARLNESLSESQCDEIVAYLSGKTVCDRDGSTYYKVSDSKPADMAFGFHSQEDVLDCPHIMEFVSSPQVVQLAAEYLGCRPTLSGVAAQWSYPMSSASVVQAFHRDSEDWKYLRFIIYLSDVDEGCGPHVFIKGSHRDRLPLRLKSYAADTIAQQHGMDSFVKVCGKRGTGIAVDTCGIHKGQLPTTDPRLVLFFTYSILAQPFFHYDPILTRHPPAMRTYSNRLFLR